MIMGFRSPTLEYQPLNRLDMVWGALINWWDNTDEDFLEYFLVNSLFLFTCLHPFPFTSSCHSADGKDEGSGLCVTMAMTSLCHFCDPSQGVKVPPKTALTRVHRPPPSFIGIPALQTAAFPPVQLPEVCLPPSPLVTCNPHCTTPRCSSFKLWERLHVLCVMPCGS